MTKLQNYDKNKAAKALADIWILLTEEQRAFLADNLIVERYKKNESIYKEGDQPNNLLCLLS